MAESIVTQSEGNESFASLLDNALSGDSYGIVDTQWATRRTGYGIDKVTQQVILQCARAFGLPEDEIKRIEQGEYEMLLEEQVGVALNDLTQAYFNAGFDFCLAFQKAVRDGDTATLSTLFQPAREGTNSNPEEASRA